MGIIRLSLPKKKQLKTVLNQGYFAKDAGFSENESEAVLNLHLRIGYSF